MALSFDSSASPPPDLSAIYEKSANRSLTATSPYKPTAAEGSIAFHRGASDSLRVAVEPELGELQERARLGDNSAAAELRRAQGWRIVRDFVYSNGDRAIHFSGEVIENQGNLSVKRIVLVTDLAVYRIPLTTLETAIFFDCRTLVDEIAQVVAFEGTAANAQVQATASNTVSSSGETVMAQFYRQGSRPAGASPSSGSSASQQDLFQFDFGPNGGAQRKALFIALSLVRPALPIMKRNAVVEAAAASPYASYNVDEMRAARQQQGSSTPGSARRRMILSPGSVSRRRTPGGDPAYAAHTAAFAARSNSATSAGTNSQPRFDDSGMAPEISDDQFDRSRAALRDLLDDHAAMSLGTYDPEAAAKRPKEESADNAQERERIKAMLKTRESQIVQAIEFRIKYPNKVPTRVPPGVEYDKAHEERHIAPDDFTDTELLGPALWDLWIRWKESGGLMRMLPREAQDKSPSPDRGGASEWTMNDSADLIDSLRAREDRLYGYVGDQSMVRLQQMRELAERERVMFANKMNALAASAKRMQEHRRRVLGIDDTQEEEGEDYGLDDYGLAGAETPMRSPSNASPRSARRSAKRTPTRPVPFKLSQSPSSMTSLKVVDTSAMVTEMRSNFEQHMKKMHELRKDQLERELHRAQEGGQ